MPAVLRGESPGELLAALVEPADAHGGVPHGLDRRLFTMACHAAVKAGDPLDEAEIESLLRQGAELEHDATCPHGRPTRFLIGRAELERLFKRTGLLSEPCSGLLRQPPAGGAGRAKSAASRGVSRSNCMRPSASSWMNSFRAGCRLVVAEELDVARHPQAAARLAVQEKARRMRRQVRALAGLDAQRPERAVVAADAELQQQPRRLVARRGWRRRRPRREELVRRRRVDQRDGVLAAVGIGDHVVARGADVREPRPQRVQDAGVEQQARQAQLLLLQLEVGVEELGVVAVDRDVPLLSSRNQTTPSARPTVEESPVTSSVRRVSSRSGLRVYQRSTSAWMRLPFSSCMLTLKTPCRLAGALRGVSPRWKRAAASSAASPARAAVVARRARAASRCAAGAVRARRAVGAAAAPARRRRAAKITSSSDGGAEHGATVESPRRGRPPAGREVGLGSVGGRAAPRCAPCCPSPRSRDFPFVHDDHDLRGPGSLSADPRADIGLLLRADLFGSVERPGGRAASGGRWCWRCSARSGGSRTGRRRARVARLTWSISCCTCAPRTGWRGC